MTKNNHIHLLKTVALLDDVPQHKLLKGSVGTVVEELDGDNYLVEFVDNEGVTYAVVALQEEQLIVLRHEPGQVA